MSIYREPTVYLPTSQGIAFLIDPEDWARVSTRKWSATVCESGHVYAVSRVGVDIAYLHRYILNAPADKWVDHRDGNTLDNRKSNLRFATPQQNAANSVRRRHGTTSQYRGVSLFFGKWQARISVLGKQRSLGTFSVEQEAARAYDAAAVEAFGEFARLNFPASAGGAQ